MPNRNPSRLDPRHRQPVNGQPVDLFGADEGSAAGARPEWRSAATHASMGSRPDAAQVARHSLPRKEGGEVRQRDGIDALPVPALAARVQTHPVLVNRLREREAERFARGWVRSPQPPPPLPIAARKRGALWSYELSWTVATMNVTAVLAVTLSSDRRFGGRHWTRTSDLLHVKQVL